MRAAKLAVIFAACTLPLAAHGQIYKCVDETEHVTYQDTACPAESQHVTMRAVMTAPPDHGAKKNPARFYSANLLRCEELAWRGPHGRTSGSARVCYHEEIRPAPSGN